MNNNKTNVRFLAQLGLLAAIEIVMKLIGLGSVPVGPLYMSFLTVPIAVGEKQGIRRKPAPDTLLTAMVQLGAERTSTVYVGDSEVDIATARAAGLPCISVLWGFRDRDVLEQAGAQQFAADTGELARLLD